MKQLEQRLLLGWRSPQDLTDPLGPEWLERGAIEITALGSHAVLTLLVVSSAVLLVFQQRRAAAAWILLSSASATLLNLGLKLMFGRPRPDLLDHLVTVVTHSFPSGHALMSAVIYSLLAGMAAQQPGTGAAVRRYLHAVAVLVAIMVGLSRIYLGVHWPSDVLAGWVIGWSWAWACLKLLPAPPRHGPARAAAKS